MPASPRVRLPQVPRDAPRLGRWHILGIGVAVFGLGYLVCRVADWLVVSDEERVAELFRSLTDRARRGQFERLLDDIDLERFGLAVRGWGERRAFGPEDRERMLEYVRRGAGHIAISTLRAALDEDDVRVDGDRARARADLIFEEGGRPYRQPVRTLFRRTGDRWYLTEFEVLRPDEFLRP